MDLDCRRLVYAIPKLRRYLQDERPDFVVSSLDHNNIAALCACATTRAGVRLIICQHNALSQEIHLGWKYRAMPFLYRVLAPRALALSPSPKGLPMTWPPLHRSTAKP